MSTVARLGAVIAGALCALTVGAIAWAFWTQGGAGTATAGTGTLAEPANVTPTSAGGSATVDLTWTDVSGPDGGAVDGYYVQRYSGATANPACASSPTALLAPGTVSCSDSGAPGGTYTYTVTVVFHSWTTESTPSIPITVDALASFAVTAPASATAGTPFSITVTAKDQANNTIAGYVGTVHFLTSDPNGAVVPMDYTFLLADNGSHGFTNGVNLKTTPSQSVTVTDVSDPTKTGTAIVTVNAGPAAQLGFTQQPGGGTGGVNWPTQPKVAVQDALGNTVTSSSASVTLAITPATGNPSGVLTCTTNPLAAVSGVASFAGCKIDLAGSGYSLTATAAGLTTVVSNPFNVAVGPATKLVYTQQPTTVVAGSTISPAVVAVVEDAGNNTVTSSSATVAIAISTNPGGGTLSGTLSINASSGIVTFSNLSINKSGVGYKLTASSAGLTSAVSGAFNVNAGPAAQLGFTQQPGGGTGGVNWPTQPKVAVQDALGNTVTSSSASVTLAITPATGNPSGVLTCTTNPLAAVSGVASFAGCKIDLAGSGYSLTATAAGLTTVVSNPFNVAVGPATKLVYTQQPTTVVAGSTISPAVVAVVEDAGNNTVTSSSATVAIAISTNPGGGTLSGTLSINASSGIVTFSNLSINKSGVGYKLTASSAGLTSAVSGAFNVNAGPAAQLGFTQQPGGGTGGVNWPTQPKVAVQDALGNTVTSSSASVTLAITPATGNPSGVLTCTTNPLAAVSGVASFAGCKIDLAGSGYSLTATAAGLTTVVSNPFNVAVGPATKLVYTQQPTTVVAGSTISPAVVAVVEDAGNNTVTSSSATVAIAISTNPGGGTLSGTLSINASSGIVTFSNLSINKSGVGYKLTASSAGLTSAVSGAFNVNAGPAAQLGFTQQPGGGTGGVNWPTQPKVAVQDALGNTVTSSSASVTLAITPATGNPSGVLTCTTNPLAAVSGVASFAGCKIDLAGSGYSLTATAAGLTTVVSNPFNVAVGPATKLVYTQQPTTVVAGSTISPAVVAVVEDAGNNTVTSSSATVAIAISTNPGGGTLSGTLSINASSGIVTFSNLSINKSGVGYKLTASSAGLTSAVSGAFNVNAGPAAQLGFTQQPGGGTGGVNWPTQPKVAVQDALGNTVTSSSASVTLAITPATGNPSGVLTCTTNPLAAVSGVASFAGCKIDLAGSGYSLTATAAGLTTVVSNPFNVS